MRRTVAAKRNGLLAAGGDGAEKLPPPMRPPSSRSVSSQFRRGSDGAPPLRPLGWSPS